MLDVEVPYLYYPNPEQEERVRLHREGKLEIPKKGPFLVSNDPFVFGRNALS